MENLFYRVKKNETLLSVSAKFSVSAATIASDNKLRSELKEGDVLFIRKTEGTVYRVKPEDSVFSIAEKFGVKEEYILEKNGIPCEHVGETIII